MAHNIDIGLIYKNYLHTDEAKENLNKYKELPYEITSFANTQIIDDNLNEGESYVHVVTDYFGGFGVQRASLFTKTNGDINEEEFDTINEALSKYGIPNSFDTDEFDQLNLGSFRRNEDFLLNPVKEIQNDVSVINPPVYDVQDMREAYEAGKNFSHTNKSFEEFIKDYTN